MQAVAWLGGNQHLPQPPPPPLPLASPPPSFQIMGPHEWYGEGNLVVWEVSGFSGIICRHTHWPSTVAWGSIPLTSPTSRIVVVGAGIISSAHTSGSTCSGWVVQAGEGIAGRWQVNPTQPLLLHPQTGHLGAAVGRLMPTHLIYREGTHMVCIINGTIPHFRLSGLGGIG